MPLSLWLLSAHCSREFYLFWLFRKLAKVPLEVEPVEVVQAE